MGINKCTDNTDSISGSLTVPPPPSQEMIGRLISNKTQSDNIFSSYYSEEGNRTPETVPQLTDYKEATDQILAEAKRRLDLQNTTTSQVEEIPIHKIRFIDILENIITPFTQESELPPFNHGSPGLPYFQTLRTYLSKLVRARLHLGHLKESMELQQVPKEMK